MKGIVSAIAAYIVMSRVSEMLTKNGKEVPIEWRIIRWMVTVTVTVGLADFIVSCLSDIVKNWPF